MPDSSSTREAAGSDLPLAYIFVSDGGPEADDYDSSRIWFDENDPASYQRALEQARRRREYIAARRAKAPVPSEEARSPSAPPPEPVSKRRVAT
jgi:hypothetical protein